MQPVYDRPTWAVELARMWAVCTFVHTIKRGVGRDPVKARANFTKHGVRFAEAVSALEDDSALTIRDLSVENEERWVTVGPGERRQYEERI